MRTRLFLGFSYGFRPGRNPHNALDALYVGIMRKRVNWMLDADIRGFFDAIDHEWLMKFVEHRIADQRVLRHIKKWLNAGVMEDGKRTQAEKGTPQGGSVSPLGSNLNVVSGLDSKSDVSVGMNPSTGPRTRLERAGPRSGPARSQTWRSGCRVPGHTPSVSTRGVGSADYPPVRIFAAIGTSRGELEERRSHKPGETFSRPNPTLSTPVFVNLRGASRDLPDQRSEFPMRGACRDPTQIHCVEHLASAG